jgi:hypothetical protein
MFCCLLLFFQQFLYSFYYHLLCAKVNFPPRWLHENRKDVSVQQEEFFKTRLFNAESRRWLYAQIVRLRLENIRIDATDVEKEWENLQYILKSAPSESLGEIKRQNKEIFKNIG